MKKLLLILGIMLVSAGMSAQQLSYRFANPRIMRGTGSIYYLNFDIQIKASVAGTYLWTSQIKLNFNNTTFNTAVGNWGITTVGAFSGYNTNLTQTLKYTLVPSITGTAPNKIFNLGLHGDGTAAANGPNPADFAEITTEWTTMVRIQARLSVTTGEAIAGIDFYEPGMNGFQEYLSGVSTFSLYTSPNVFDSRDFTSDYTGRFYSTLYGWSQIGGGTNNTQYLNWGTNVSTTVWEGSATVTQNDDETALANNLLIKNGSILTIPSDKWLTVSGNLTISGGSAYSNLIVESGGSLITSSASIPATVRRTVSQWGVPWHGWHLLSSPVTAQAIDPAFTTVPANTYDFYAWNEPTTQWVNFKNNITPPVWATANVLNVNGSTVQGGGNFIPGKGYLINYAAAGTKTFTGTLNKDNILVSNLSIKPLSTDKGWHLLGNPFTSALVWGTNWNLTNIITTTKIWNEATAAYVDIPSGGVIPALNGFMIQVTPTFGGNNSLTMPVSQRVHNITPWYKSGNSPSISLVANDPDGQMAQESILQVDNGATTGFDPEFDSHFLPGYAPLFYSVAGQEQLSTNTLPDLGGSVQVPFDFVKNSSTNFSIEAKSISNIQGPVFLNDLKTNARQDLTLNPMYNFTSDAGDLPGRFLLTFSTVGMGENASANSRIYAYERTIYVVDPGKATLELFNLSGQKLLTESINTTGLYKIATQFPVACYVARLTTGTKVVVTKIFLK
ncbi:MAG: hypothetical protein ACOYNC_18330 [Bacteroidales bacterium]